LKKNREVRFLIGVQQQALLDGIFRSKAEFVNMISQLHTFNIVVVFILVISSVHSTTPPKNVILLIGDGK